MIGGLFDHEGENAVDLVLVIVLGRNAEQRKRRAAHGVGERQIELDAVHPRIGVDQTGREHVSADVEGEANGAIVVNRRFGEAQAEDGGVALDDQTAEGFERGDLRIVVADGNLGAVDVDIVPLPVIAVGVDLPADDFVVAVGVLRRCELPDTGLPPVGALEADRIGRGVDQAARAETVEELDRGDRHSAFGDAELAFGGLSLDDGLVFEFGRIQGNGQILGRRRAGRIANGIVYAPAVVVAHGDRLLERGGAGDGEGLRAGGDGRRERDGDNAVGLSDGVVDGGQRERSDALTGDGAEGDGLLETCGFGIGVGERGGEAIARLGDSRVEAAAGDGRGSGELDAELGGFTLGDRLACRSQSVDFGIVVEHLQRDPGAGLAIDERVRAFDSVLDRRRIVVGVGIGVEHGDQLAAAPPVVGSVGRAADCQRSGLDGEPIGVGAGKVVSPVGGS